MVLDWDTNGSVTIQFHSFRFVPVRGWTRNCERGRQPIYSVGPPVSVSTGDASHCDSEINTLKAADFILITSNLEGPAIQLSYEANEGDLASEIRRQVVISAHNRSQSHCLKVSL